MSRWDRLEHDVASSQVPRKMADLFKPTALSTGSPAPSPLPTSFPNGGASPLLMDRLRPAPPKRGEDPSFDAKVAAEYFRLKGVKTSFKDGGPSDFRSNEEGGGVKAGGTLAVEEPPPEPDAFESDVEKAMRELEVRLAGDDKSSGSRYLAPSSQRRPPSSPQSPPPPPAVSGRPELSDPRPAADDNDDDEGSFLFQMDMRRVAPGGGKGRPGGLRDMWDRGGAGSNGGSERIFGGERPRRGQPEQQYGGGNAAAFLVSDGAGPFATGNGGRRQPTPQQGQRHGPGLKGMWGGEQREEALRPQRQGPGLRGLWSGPDIAAADVAKSEAQAAYFSALNRDVQERRKFSSDLQEQQQHLGGRGDGRESPHGASGGNDSSSRDYGTSLAGIGTPRGDTNPHPQWRGLSLGAQGADSVNRAADRAKKAAYAEELRKQMAEKEMRLAMEDDNLSTGGRRRASTGGRSDLDGGGGSERSGHGCAPTTLRSLGRESYPAHSVSGGTPGSTFPCRADPIHDRWASAAWSSTPKSGGGSSGGSTSGVGAPSSDGHLTAARRRLVEDVYGGGGMGAALGGAGYRRASTGSHAAVGNGEAGYSSRIPTVDQVGGEGGNESWLAGGSEGGGAAKGGDASFLRTGAGVQSLNESELGDNRSQRRAAALEQQRALEAQIAAKARAKKKEEDERRREDEEEARQQRERLRRLEAEAEAERRRKQAEQQKQLEGLYRQQEEALQKKRGGASRQSNGGEGKDFRAPASDGGASIIPDDDTAAAAAAEASAGYYNPDGDFSNGSGCRRSRPQPRRAVDIMPPLDVDDNAGGNSARRETPRRWGAVQDVDDLPAGAQARAQALRSSPPAPSGGDVGAGGGGGKSGPRPSSRRSGSASSGRRGNLPHTANGRFQEAGLEADAKGVEEKLSGATKGSAFGSDGGVPAGPPLQTRSLLVPVSSGMLFPDNVAASNSRVSPRPMVNAPGPIQHSLARTGAADDVERHRDASAAGFAAAAAGVEAFVPQDEMDAYVTKWQDEHLRGRRRRQQQQDGKEEMHGGCELRPAPYPGARTIYGSPPRRLLGNSRWPANGTRRRGPASAAGGTGELEESLAASSRIVNPPTLPLPDPTANAGGAGAGTVMAATSGRGGGREPRLPVASAGGGGEGTANLSEQSLTSDSILFYLSGEQESTAERTDISPKVAAAGSASTLRGATVGNRTPRIAPSLMGLGEDSSEVGVGGESEYGWEHGGDGDGGDEDQMSPLTRLLAETPVRLKTDPTALPLGSDPRTHRLAPGGRHDRDDLGAPTAEAAAAAAARVSPGGSTSWPSRGNGGSGGSSGGVLGGRRRARALWNTPSAGGANARGVGDAVSITEALTRGGGGKSWEEMPTAEVRGSPSGAPLH